MRSVLLIICSFAVVHSKRFVLLDPDDPNLEKSASDITDSEVRSNSIKMAKFRKWLKYDVDCEFISRSELEVKISHGRCPFEHEAEKIITTTKEPKSLFFKRKRRPVTEKDKSLFSHDNKETVVRAVVGNNKMQDIDWTPTSSPVLELVGGSMVTFRCDEENRKKHGNKKDETEFIEWFVNGKRIKPSWFDWRVSVSLGGRLGVWPIGIEDSGHFECLSNGQLRASVTVKVIPVSNVLINGLLNYFFVCAIFAVATISMGCLLGNRNQEKKHMEVDRMEEFLAENVFKTDQMAKEKVAGIIEKQGVVDERQLIENKANSNRSTIMILLQKPMVEDVRKMRKEPGVVPENSLTLSSFPNGTNRGNTTTETEGKTTETSSGTTGSTDTKTTEFTNKAPATTTETEVTGTTVTKTEEEDRNGPEIKKNREENGDEGGEGYDDDDDEDVASSTASTVSNGTSKPSKGPKKGKEAKKVKGKGTKKTKKTNKKTSKEKKNTKNSKAKGGTKKGNNTKKKVSKPTKKKK